MFHPPFEPAYLCKDPAQDFSADFAPHQAYVRRFDNTYFDAERCPDVRTNTHDLLDLYFSPGVCDWQQPDYRPWMYGIDSEARSSLYLKPPIDYLPTNETAAANAQAPRFAPSGYVDRYSLQMYPPIMNDPQVCRCNRFGENCFSG